MDSGKWNNVNKEKWLKTSTGLTGFSNTVDYIV